MKTVLFDLDGTLLDTEASILKAFEYAFAVHGVSTPSNEHIRTKMGRPLREMYRDFAPHIDTESLVDAHRDHQVRNVDLVVPFPGTRDVLTELRDNSFRLGIVTSRLRPSTEKYLAHTGLDSFFGVVVTGDDVAQHKPHPEPVEKALKSLDAQNVNTFFVGDTIADIGAGKSAGVLTIAALYGHGSNALRNLEPDHTIDSLPEIIPIVLR